MNKRQRITNIIIGLISISCAVAISVFPKLGIGVVLLLLCISFIMDGLKDVIYYISMARHMVGGKIVLYKGVLQLDLGLFTMTLASVPNAYIMIYLIVMLLFDGIIDVIRTLESKRLGAKSWKFNLVSGLISIAIAVMCIFSISSIATIVYVYGLGLVYSGCVRIARALRKTAIVYIQ